MAETRHISIFPECYFDPDAVVWRAVREIIQELAPPACHSSAQLVRGGGGHRHQLIPSTVMDDGVSMQYSHSAGKGMVSAGHRELLEQMGSPEALKVALRRKHNAFEQHHHHGDHCRHTKPSHTP
ncbi:hypothetical protein AAFF_G00204570 [Aldrovandia affinis]|uniref:Uncharacterized protein n=1 Tax=Aldrovandia affinis TaxID=143900 RepID=A0AAD7R007_9TELE|nr:hypothetical protein AAFF_G00204570 [Aldrovandia affinis]